MCHTLLLDSGSRRVRYSLLLIETQDIDQEKLIETAQWYDLEPTVKALYRPLQGDLDRTNDLPVILPKKGEYMALKEQYGVS
nr:hypothetical protein [Haloplanus natans]